MISTEDKLSKQVIICQKNREVADSGVTGYPITIYKKRLGESNG